MVLGQDVQDKCLHFAVLFSVTHLFSLKLKYLIFNLIRFFIPVRTVKVKSSKYEVIIYENICHTNTQLGLGGLEIKDNSHVDVVIIINNIITKRCRYFSCHIFAGLVSSLTRSLSGFTDA